MKCFQHCVVLSHGGERIELEVRASRQGICHNIGMARSALDVHVIGCQSFLLPCLFGSQGLLGVEEPEGGVIGDQASTPSIQVHSPGFEGMNNG